MPSNPAITSLRNPFFRHCLQLRDNRKRRRAGQFLIDGSTEIARAIEAGISIQTVLMAEQFLDRPLIALAEQANVSIQTVSLELLDRLSYGQVERHPVALATTPPLPLESLRIDSKSLVLVLDRTEKPGNLGACLRTAAACGVDAVVLTDPVCDPFNANAIRASRGTVFRVPMAISSFDEFLKLAAEIELPICAARVDASKTLWNLPLSNGAALVFGSEAEGLNDNWRRSFVQDFTIPMSTVADSLNLSISVAVTLYEGLRQRASSKI